MLEETSLPINRGEMFKVLFINFLKVDNGIEAIIVSDEEGFIIAGEKRMDIDIELISFLTAIVNPVIERLREEFAFKRFGTASFDTDEHHLVFISIDGTTTLSIVYDDSISIDKLYPYAYFLAEKIIQILRASTSDIILLKIPIFELEEELSRKSNRLKYQIYKAKLDQDGSYRFKFIITGDHSVGKTSLVKRFVENRFIEDYRTTIGLNILSHYFNAFGNSVNLTLWDIGAQKYFKRYRKSYYKGAQAAFIVFDLTSRESFENVEKWYKELMEFIEDKDLPIIVIGNKSDLLDQRVIQYEEGVNLANKIFSKLELYDVSNLNGLFDFSDLESSLPGKISYIETSALTGDHVEEAFSLVSYHFMIRAKEAEERLLKKKIIYEINSILENYGSLKLSFITEDPLWSPALQILTQINELGNFNKVKDTINEKFYQYSNGLILGNYICGSFNFIDSDGIFCIFDARGKEHIDPIWKKTVIEIKQKFKDNIAIIIGIKVSENLDWPKLIKEFDINENIKENIENILFFKIGKDYKLEIYELLEFMLNLIKQRLLEGKLEDDDRVKSSIEVEKILREKEEKIKELSSKISELKEKIESPSIADEIRARKSFYKAISKEKQIKFTKTRTKIDNLKNKIIKYEKKGVKDDKLKEAWYKLGHTYLKNHEYEKAIDSLERAIEIDAKFLEAWNVLGVTYFVKRDYNNSINVFQHLLELRPKDHTVWYNLGRTYVKIGAFDDAIEALKRALEINFNFAPAWNVLGASYYVKKEYSKAIKTFINLLKFNSDDYSLWYNLGRAYIKIGEFDDAIEALNSAIKINFNFAPAWNILGASYYGKGEYSKAIEAFKNFVNLDPDDHIAWYNLAEALFIVKYNNEALNACNNCLDIDFKFEEALNLREKILANL